MPRSPANIDHILVSPAGVFVVDAKNYRGTIAIRNRGWFFRPDYRLYVGRRDCSDLATGLEWQVAVVTAALTDAGIDPLPLVTPVLCFIDGEWPLFGAPDEYAGVRLEGTGSIRKLMASSTILEPSRSTASRVSWSRHCPLSSGWRRSPRYTVRTMSKKKRSDLQAAAADLGKTTPYDRLLDAATDGISTLVPFAGGLVAGLIRQAAPRDDKIYLEAFAQDVADRIVDIEADKIDRSYFETPEWQGDVNRVMDALREERNRNKREHYIAALANSASSDRPDEVERHRFLDLLQSLRPSHLRSWRSSRPRRTPALLERATSTPT